ncbi:MAG: DUF3100 domain-containing protein, partial [Cytophagaceae bacterium]
MPHIQVATLDDNQAVSATTKLYIWAAIVLVLAELIGSISIPLGPGKVVLLPMVWALLLGAGVGIASKRLPGTIGIDNRAQLRAASILQPALLIFIAKLGLVVGGS